MPDEGGIFFLGGAKLGVKFHRLGVHYGTMYFFSVSAVRSRCYRLGQDGLPIPKSF